jgi:Zn-dependent protease with chaperone function
MKALAISLTANIVGREIAASDLDLTPGDDDTDDLLSTILKVGIGVATAAAGDAAGANTLTSASLKSEFEADESGATLAQKPWALVSALERIQRMTQFGYKKYDPDVSQLFIISPSYLNHKTHPPTSERVERLSHLLAKHPIVARVPTIYCSICGEKSDADGNYCYWCGNELIEQ